MSAQITQPKNLRRMLYRSAVLLFVVAAAIVGYRFYAAWSQDIDLPAAADTSGYVSAIQLLEEGSQAVVFKPDGTLLPSPGYSPGKNDKDAVWRPDGHRLFFISDREDNAQNVYRWNFGAGSVARRTYNSRTKGIPAFLPGSQEAGTALITSGPFVLEFDPSRATTRQVLPPVAKDRVAVDDEGGAGGQFDAAYRILGNSFREAKWTPDKRFVAAVMRREEGEALILQEIEGDKSPIPIVAGDHIEFDVDPATGRVVFLVLNFRFIDPKQAPPELIKEGRIVLPFRHVVSVIDPALISNPETARQPGATLEILRSSKDEEAFHELSVAPDGSRILLVVGRYDPDKGRVEPEAMASMPMVEGGQGGSLILRAKVYEPSWHPNSSTIAFVMYNAQGKRAVHTINRDGGGLKDLSGDRGDFAFPRLSPQSK